MAEVVDAFSLETTTRTIQIHAGGDAFSGGVAVFVFFAVGFGAGICDATAVHTNVSTGTSRGPAAFFNGLARAVLGDTHFALRTGYIVAESHALALDRIASTRRLMTVVAPVGIGDAGERLRRRGFADIGNTDFRFVAVGVFDDFAGFS